MRSAQSGRVLERRAMLAQQRHHIDVTAVARSRPRAVALPAPSLDDLSVEVPSPPPIDADALIAALERRIREATPSRPRARGEPVALGDEITIAVIFVAGGQLVPGGTHDGRTITLAPLPELPGFAERLVGLEVHAARAFDYRFPEAYPDPALAGVEARVYVEIVAARAIAMPELDDPAALAAAGLGPDLETAMRVLRGELEAEQDEAMARAWVEAVLDRVAERVEGEVPARLVDEELARRWLEGEGAMLRARGFSTRFQQQALACWLGDPELRADAERRLRLALSLGALADPADGPAVVDRLARAMGLTDVALPPRDRDRVLADASWIAVVERVLARATAVVDG